MDGTDALAVYVVANEAVSRARAGKGPTLIEAKTHRRGGHAEGEEAFLAGQTYRLPEEVERAQARDPLLFLHEHILQDGVADAHALESIDQEATELVVKAVTFARESPWPGPETVLEDTWGLKQVSKGEGRNMPRKTTVDAIREALRAEMQRDERVVLMGEDVRLGVFAGTRWLHREFGDGARHQYAHFGAGRHREQGSVRQRPVCVPWLT